MSDWTTSLDTNKRVHVLHPYSDNSTRLEIIHEALQLNALYWRLDGCNLDADMLLAQWQEAASLYHHQDWILIDEADRASDGALGHWLDHVLPAQAQLIVITRRIPACIYAPSRRQYCEIFPHDPVRMVNDFTRYSGERHLLEVRTLGKNQVLLNGCLIDHWEGILPRLLFFYFIDKGIATRANIFDAFWRDVPVKEATNIFHVTKRKIHEILGFELTVYDGGFYRIAPYIDLSYDVLSFSRLVQESEIVDDAAADRLISDAISLYHGEFLSLLDSPWIIRRRHEITLAYADALARLAAVRQHRGQLVSAVNLYLKAWSIGGQDDSWLYLAAQLAEKQGDRTLAQAILAQGVVPHL
ncbi:MAG: bacterial transcriptional activator domain-containing protein [Anaerolineae bacterium]|nr:bacterial transcriptional activator domain-containing protein [Anaerolineae bacterium]MDW8170980.1 bacterial transcriptional activator domain-containing protein [Anaerolineae bacterium]